MLARWRARHGDIIFDVRLLEDEGLVDEGQKETIYRVVQESLNNAVRHGRPTRIEVEVSLAAGGEIVTRISDNGTAGTKATHAGRHGQTGFGLIGMRERVTASGGALSIDRGDSAAGWTVMARLPATAPVFSRIRMGVA